MSGKLRIGVIGLGIMGEQYVRVFQANTLTEVTAVSTRSPERYATFGSPQGNKRLTDDRRHGPPRVHHGDAILQSGRE